MLKISTTNFGHFTINLIDVEAHRVYAEVVNVTRRGENDIRNVEINGTSRFIYRHPDSKWYECWTHKFDRKPAKKFTTLKAAVEFLTGEAQDAC